jgi:purine nucleosidase
MTLAVFKTMERQFLASRAEFHTNTLKIPVKVEGVHTLMKKVIYDQDGLGRRDHNLYGLLVLLQAPGVELVGLSTVSGREWSSRQVPRARQVLDLLGRPEVPVVGGAVFPLLNSPARSAAWESMHGALFDRLCFESADLEEPTEADPFWVPVDEGNPSFGARPTVGPTAEPAAVFMTRMARQHPGELSIVATGPLTNLALACRLDPTFPRLVKEVIFVGGRFRPFSLGGHFTRTPSRREANFRHDPEAAHIVLQAEWTRLLCLPRDLTDTVCISPEMHAAITKARTPVGRFVAELPYEFYTKGDALAAAVCAQPGLVKATDKVCLDVDLSPGANYGCTLNWREVEFAPATNQRPVEVVTAVDEEAFAKLFELWCKGKNRKIGRKKAQKAQK